MYGHFTRCRPIGRALAACLLVSATASAAETDEIRELRLQMEALARQNRELSASVAALTDQVETARDEARAARDAAEAAPAGGAPAAAPFGAPPAVPADSRALAETTIGETRLQLLDISLDTLWAFGSSTAENDELVLLQGGGHDPRQRGFNLPQVELSFSGAVDPYFTGEAHLVYFLDAENESRFELEEAFVQTLQLPFGLHEYGAQLELGTFLTEFGRMNPRHPHAWDWQDQPIVLTRFFGEDGLRGPGARLGWLLPLPWYSEVHVGAQNANGETMTSFLANDEVFEERPIGGRPFARGGMRDLGDLLYLLRWVNGGDLSDTWSTQVGVSFLNGPNATGPDGTTRIYGVDGVLKWKPLVSDHGWPFVKIEGELMKRDYRADSFLGCAGDEPCAEPLALGGKTLRDWGGYAQLLWGFRRPWAAGLRYEYASGSGASVGPYAGRSADPYRDDRHRIAPLLVYYPSEFARLRLQYDYDRSDFTEERANHTVWLGLEFGLGPHAAHGF
jgi:outer membrane murein-binding lipoprotein Lpp